MGNALGIAQFGGTAPIAKPWKGLGPGLLEMWSSRTTATRIGRCNGSVRKGGIRPARVPEEVAVRYPDGEAGY